MSTPRLDLDRTQILAHRRRVQALDERLPRGATSLRHAAWAGLQDSMPRAALLSIHARVEGVKPDAWEDASLAQMWGPRYAAYVVPGIDLPVFALARLPDDAASRRRAHDLADRLHAFLDGRTMTYRDAGHGLGIPPNRLRYAAATGRVLIRWAGARAPTIWTGPVPDLDPRDARIELARRYLHFFGPTTPESFARWAGIKPPAGRAAFDALASELTSATTKIGDSWILSRDEASFRAPAGLTAEARLLPSGDTYFLLWGADRELLVTEARRRAELWTPRVWPGAVLVDGEIAGTWRRDGSSMTIETWRPLAPAERTAIEGEAASLPLPDLRGEIRVRWDRLMTTRELVARRA